MIKQWKAKFDAWILSLDPYLVTSNVFFILALVNFWRVFDFFLFVFCGILWRYAAGKTKAIEEKVEEQVEESSAE